jgi:hypothetical protein
MKYPPLCPSLLNNGSNKGTQKKTRPTPIIIVHPQVSKPPNSPVGLIRNLSINHNPPITAFPEPTPISVPAQLPPAPAQTASDPIQTECLPVLQFFGLASRMAVG